MPGAKDKRPRRNKGRRLSPAQAAQSRLNGLKGGDPTLKGSATIPSAAMDAVRVDLYAYDNPLGFTSWVGPIPGDEKEAALLPYKYFFTAENNSEHNFITEKLWEPLLSETLCFYWGCPNAADWVDPRAFIRLDLDDFEGAFQVMKRAILANEWEKRLDIIRREKRKVLDHYQFFPTLERILHHEMRMPLHPSND